MTKNRFKHSEFQQDDGQYQYYGIEDTEKNFVYNVGGEELEMYDVSEKLLIKILNELDSENKELKEGVEELNEICKYYEMRIKELSEQADAVRTELQLCEEENNELQKENEQLKNKIDVLEDDNETYHKSLEQLNLYTKRFIPTKCTNEFKDCKTNRYYWLDHEGNFEGCLELLNLLDCEREVLQSENRQLKGRLILYEEQIKGDLE